MSTLRPNILFMLSDDHATEAVGAYLLKLQAELGDSPLRMPPGLRLRRPAQARLLALAAAVGGKGAASAMLQAHAAMNHSDVPAQYEGLKP